MSLTPPNVAGGISTASDSVRLKGQLVGATITVFQNGSPIVQRKATYYDEIFTFNAGTSLAKDDKITTQQELPSEPGFITPTPTLVREALPVPGNHRFVSHVYECGRSLFLDGIMPGAEVDLFNRYGNPRGSAKSVDGGVVVQLPSPTSRLERFTARQRIRGVSGTDVHSNEAETPSAGHLNGLNMEELLAGMTSIHITGAIDGAQLLFRTRSDDPTSELSYEIPLSKMDINVPTLVEGQKISYQQILMTCQLRSGIREIKVSRARAPYSPPVIDGPLCVGTQRIHLRQLQKGAEVTVRRGTKKIAHFIASEEDGTFSAWVEPLLQTGGSVIATASRGGVDVSSAAEPVKSSAVNITPCKIVEPLFGCVYKLWLEDVDPGSWVAAFSDSRSQISDSQFVRGKAGEIDLSSPLEAGTHVWVEQTACGGMPVKSINQPFVQAAPQLPAPTIDGPVFLDQPWVHVVSSWPNTLPPGARVQLYAQEWGYINEAIAYPPGEAYVPHSGVGITLFAGWHVSARAVLCDQYSGFNSPPQVVTDRQPLKPVLLTPANSATGVSRRPTFSWSDPGGGTFRQASDFLLEVTTAADPTFFAIFLAERVGGTSFTPTRDFNFNTKYLWRVTGYVGERGYEAASFPSQASFTVMAEPTPASPTPPTPVGFSAAFIYNCHASGRAVDIYVRDETAGSPFTFVKTLAAQYDGSGFCPGSGATPVEIKFTDGHVHHIVAVDPDLIGCKGSSGTGDPTILACRKIEFRLLGRKDGPAASPLYIN